MTVRPDLDRPGFDPDDGSCLWCDGHAVERKNHTTKQVFHGCSNFPKCRNAAPPPRRRGSFLVPDEELDRAYYDAFYDGDGK